MLVVVSPVVVGITLEVVLVKLVSVCGFAVVVVVVVDDDDSVVVVSASVPLDVVRNVIVDVVTTTVSAVGRLDSVVEGDADVALTVVAIVGGTDGSSDVVSIVLVD